MITFLHGDTPFPPVEQALRSPNGLLAAGGDLTPARLLDAYRHGIFPWFNAGDPILWWSPDPRMVLFPEEFKISRSLRKTLRNRTYEIRTDTAFEQVMRACAEPRKGRGCNTLLAEPADCGSSRLAALPAPGSSTSPCQGGHTWITEEMVAAYTGLHRMGYAHSVESWLDGKLAGGLYGIGIGRMFYGESMFSRATDASKAALAHLAAQLQRWESGPSTGLITSDSAGVVGQPSRMASSSIRTGMIDCQMNTPHLASLGARELPRTEFIQRLQELIHYPDIAPLWKFDNEPVA